MTYLSFKPARPSEANVVGADFFPDFTDPEVASFYCGRSRLGSFATTRS